MFLDSEITNVLRIISTFATYFLSTFFCYNTTTSEDYKNNYTTNRNILLIKEISEFEILNAPKKFGGKVVTDPDGISSVLVKH